MPIHFGNLCDINFATFCSKTNVSTEITLGKRYLSKRDNLAKFLSEWPILQEQSRYKSEWDAENGHQKIADCQINNEIVGDSSHSR